LTKRKNFEFKSGTGKQAALFGIMKEQARKKSDLDGKEF
jgi:hypothetical protein